MGIRNIKKQLIGKEDLELGFGQIIQERNGKNLEISRINAGIIPYTEDKSVSDVLDSLANYSVNSIAELKTISNIESINVLGYYEKGEGGGGTFYWDATSTETDNGGTIIQATGVSTGRWKRVFSDAVNVKWFGAKGDGVTDDTIAIKNTLAVNGDIIIPDGNYIVYDELPLLHSGTTIRGVGYASITQKSLNKGLFVATEKVDIEIENIILIGYGAEDTASTLNADNDPILVNARAFGVFYDRCENVRVTNCIFKYFKNYAIRAAYCSNVYIKGNEINGTYPDEDIQFGDTSRQQFGILIYAESAAEFGKTMLDVISGTGNRHNCKNIYIENNIVTQTAIGICVFPGFKNVFITNNNTHGTLSQHSVYSYPEDGLNISDNQFVANQSVGVKISCNVVAELYTPKNIIISKNIIKNTYAPSISVEMFDKMQNGSFSTSRSSVFFENIIISNNIISDGLDTAMSIACSINCTINNNKITEIRPTASRNVIDIRGSTGNIFANTIDGANVSAIGGNVNISKEGIKVDNNIFVDCCGTSTNPYFSLSLPVEPFDFTNSLERYINWYSENAIIKNPITNECYRVIGNGLSSDTAPTGTGDITSGSVVFRYIGLYSEQKSNIYMDGNRFLVKNGTLSTRAVNINTLTANFWVKNNYADSPIDNSILYGNFYEDYNNNFKNTSKGSRILVGFPSGNGRAEYFNTVAPTTGTYEKGDIVWHSNPVASGYIGWICVARGTPGTWKTFGAISA